MATESIAQLVAESRAAQGIPPKITDPAVVARIATLLAASDQAGGADIQAVKR